MDRGQPSGPGRSATGAGRSGITARIRRAWATPTGRRRITVAAAVVTVLVVVGVAALMFASLSGESQSYKDGYSAGGNVYAADSTQTAPTDACQVAARRSPADGGPAVGDNVSQWVAGCVAAFNASQGDN